MSLAGRWFCPREYYFWAAPSRLVREVEYEREGQREGACNARRQRERGESCSRSDWGSYKSYMELNYIPQNYIITVRICWT